MNRTGLSVLALAATASLASAEVVTQSLSYAWSSDQPQQPFSFDAFDAMGGTRVLTGVTMGFEGTISMELLAQTFDPRGVAAGEWSVEASHTVVAYFNQGEQGGLELLLGIGGQVLDGVTGDLGPGEGGGPGTPYVETQSFDLLSVVSVDASGIADFIGTGQHTGFMDGFYDAVVTPPEGGQFVEVFANLLTQSGTVTLTYEYSVVPAPGGLVLLGAGGLVICRRRRR